MGALLEENAQLYLEAGKTCPYLGEHFTISPIYGTGATIQQENRKQISTIRVMATIHPDPQLWGLAREKYL